MGKLARQTKEELKRLPLMLGKVLGGIAASIGIMMLVLTMTRTSDTSFVVILPPLLTANAGIIVFLLSDWALTRSFSIGTDERRPVDITRMNVLSWALFLLFAAILLAGSFFLTGLSSAVPAGKATSATETAT